MTKKQIPTDKELSNPYYPTRSSYPRAYDAWFEGYAAAKAEAEGLREALRNLCHSVRAFADYPMSPALRGELILAGASAAEAALKDGGKE